MFTVTAEWLDKYKTPRGGYCYLQTTALGVKWPLVSGWKKSAVGKQITDEQRQIFEAGSLGKSTAKQVAVDLLGLKVRETKKERRARRALEKSINVIENKKPVKSANTFNSKGKAQKTTVAGVSVESKDFLQTYEWRRVRMEALKKYGPVCQCCGASPATGAVMNVDHIKPRKIFPHLALDVDNLQVLCSPCNHGKGNWDMTDWRAAEDPPDLVRLVKDIGLSDKDRV
jgi:5-methylcytosine-specific restriction endonuclease McrA